MKKLLALLLAVLMIAGTCVAFSSCKKGDETIKIGLSGPLTGGAAVYGLGVANAAQMAVEEINAKGGINGIKLELKVMDDANDATKIANNYAALVDWGMQLSLGCVTTQPALEFKALSKTDNIFFMTPSASADAVRAESNGYQMCFADKKQGVAAANYVNGLGLTKIGVFYQSDIDYSQGIFTEFKANLNDTITVVEASFTNQTKSDFTQQVSTLKDCEFIFMPIYYTPAAAFMNAANGKIANSAVYYGCDGFDGIDTSVDGFDITKIPQAVHMLSHFNSKATEGKAADYIAKYKAAYPNGPLNQFGASAYDCVYALVAAMNKAIDEGKDITADIAAAELCDILTEQFKKGFAFSGATGDNITWDANGFVAKGAIAYEIKGANA